MKKLSQKTAINKIKKLITENEVKRQVRDYLKLMGWFSFPLTAGLGSYKGSPDRIAVKDGRVLFLEIKKPIGGKHSDYQKQFQADLEEHGGEYYLVRSLEEVMRIIEI